MKNGPAGPSSLVPGIGLDTTRLYLFDSNGDAIR